MSHDPKSETPPDAPALSELLVAYLDGELDTAESRRVEGLIASDAKVREEMTRLERTWGALDCLDREQVDERFTKSTLEMIALAAEADLAQEQEAVPRRRLRWALAGTAIVLLALGAGFGAVNRLKPNPNRQLLEDLPVIEDLDELKQIDDIEFLRRLQREGLFDKNGQDHG